MITDPVVVDRILLHRKARQFEGSFAARAPDGSFQPRPGLESLSMGSNSDVTFGQVWTTAAWAIVLACEPEKGVRPGLPYWMGLKRVGGLKRK